MWKKKGKVEDVTYEELGNAGFALDIGGRKYVAMKLERMTARDIAGQAKVDTSGGGVGGRYASVSDTSWLLIADKQNPMVYDGLGRLLELSSNALTNASGSQVQPTNILFSTSSSVTTSCKYCGTTLSSDHVGRCPKCGKEGRLISVSLSEAVDVRDEVLAHKSGS